MRAVLDTLGIGVQARPVHVPEVEETSDTLEGNALLKARALCEATGVASIADDTGLFVDALDGRPGVYSARYAGGSATYEQNVEKLLDELRGVGAARRTARFRTVVAVAFANGGHLVVDGVLEGVITETPRGSFGFGYDSVFEPLGGSGRTLAELSAQEKNVLSHRSRALVAIAEALRQNRSLHE